ncbi:UNVERIFIED_CONTAM: hypothetical protein RMT77_006537 [Armadillidium vulgare]
MQDEFVSTFGVVDYCVFAVMFIIPLAIGIYSTYRGNKSPEEFFMGNRTFNTIPVAMSLMSSYVSAISLLGYSGEAYAFGTQLSTFVLGIALAVIFSTHFALPVLYPLTLTSVNEYINLRFKSRSLQMTISLLTLMKILFYNGLTLYAPTIALSSLTNLDTLTSILLLGIVCSIYSAFGGIRAIIWTDIFQLVVMVIGLVLVFVIGSAQNGGIIKTFYTSSEGGRLNIFNMNLSPFVRNTFFNTVAYGFFTYSYLYTANQINFQRMCTVKSMKQAKRVLFYNIYGSLILYFLIFSCGLVAYVSYAGCDPLTLGVIKNKEEILTYFITDKLSFVTGLSGIFLATLISGSLSTISSAINACAALIWRDVFLKISYFQRASSKCSTLTNKTLSLVVGTIITGLAILASKAKGLVGMSMTIMGTFQGPILGVFLIGYFLPKCNVKGVWTGFLLSSGFGLWISLGSLIYKQPTTMLPFSVDECDRLNITSNNFTFKNYVQLPNITEENGKSFSIVFIYQISKTLYGALTTSLCIFLAVVASCLTGNQSINKTSPDFITPCLRKYYWKTKEMKILNEQKTEVIDDGTKENLFNRRSKMFLPQNN